jgi:AcrR family transcriptional regulator
MVGHMTYAEVAESAMAAQVEPRETKGERTRRRLLEEAINRFGDRGFRATSVSEVARSIGLTQAASYAYFESKTDLYRAAVDADTEALIDEVVEQLDGMPIRQALPAMIALLVAGLDRHPLAKRIMMGHDPEALERLLSLPSLDQGNVRLAEALALEQEAGTVRGDVDPEMLARGAQAIIFGLVMSSAQLGQQPRPEVILGVLHALDAMVRPIDG